MGRKKKVINKDESAEGCCFVCKDGGTLRVCDYKWVSFYVVASFCMHLRTKRMRFCLFAKMVVSQNLRFGGTPCVFFFMMVGPQFWIFFYCLKCKLQGQESRLSLYLAWSSWWWAVLSWHIVDGIYEVVYLLVYSLFFSKKKYFPSFNIPNSFPLIGMFICVDE